VIDEKYGGFFFTPAAVKAFGYKNWEFNSDSGIGGQFGDFDLGFPRPPQFVSGVPEQEGYECKNQGKERNRIIRASYVARELPPPIAYFFGRVIGALGAACCCYRAWKLRAKGRLVDRWIYGVGATALSLYAIYGYSIGTWFFIQIFD